MIVAAAPAPPVPAPPGRPPLPPSSSSSLSRRSSSWWFSNGNAHGRDSATATTSSRATRRRWWSDPDGSEQDYYGSSSLEEEDDYGYDYDYEDEAGFPGFGGVGELFDEPWFSKVFKMYGFLLPVMLVSMFAATGTKAFLMAMAFPLGQSAISFLLDLVWGRRKGNRDDRSRRRVQEEEEEEYADFATGGRGNRYNGGSSSRYYEGRTGWRNYQSRNDFADASSTAVGADESTKSSSSSSGAADQWNNSSGDGGGVYGGWDELLDDNNTAAAQEAKRSSNSFSAGNTNYSTKPRPSATREEDADYTAAGGGRRVEQGVGVPSERMRMGRRRMPRTMGLGTTRYKQVPLLMRLLVAVFPFMGSWFRL